MKKKLLIVLVILAMFVVANTEINSGKLSKDANGESIQAGRSWQMYSNAITALEHLDENDFATHADWATGGTGADFVDTGGNATWTFGLVSEASTLTQANAGMIESVRDVQVLQLKYTVAITTDVEETLTLDVSPATDWAAADVVTGQTSGITSIVVSKTDATHYVVKTVTGTYTLDEIIGVTGTSAKLADQGAAHPTIAGVTVAASGICASTTLPQTAGTHEVDILTTSAGGAFVITVTSGAATSAGVLVFDDIYLTSKYESPLTIATGTDISFTIPDEAVELIVDPVGTEIRVENGVCYYILTTGRAMGCSGTETITIANDSGGDATVYFYYNMIIGR